MIYWAYNLLISAGWILLIWELFEDGVVETVSMIIYSGFDSDNLLVKTVSFFSSF